jgi:hypothetical protein
MDLSGQHRAIWKQVGDKLLESNWPKIFNDLGSDL